MEDMQREPMEPEYPYGLCLHISQPELEKLGVKVEDYKIGDTMSLDAIAKVTGVSQSSDGYACLDLQITDLGLETDEDEDAKPVAKDFGSQFYGDD